jgi:Tfp pilus assembly protein PilF
VLVRQGKYAEAEAMQQQALQVRNKVLGPEHPDTLASVSEFGWVLVRLGKYAEAEAMQQQALQVRNKVLGPEHPDTLASVSEFGWVLVRLGKYAEAEAMHQQALQPRDISPVLRVRGVRQVEEMSLCKLRLIGFQRPCLSVYTAVGVYALEDN